MKKIMSLFSVCVLLASPIAAMSCCGKRAAAAVAPSTRPPVSAAPVTTAKDIELARSAATVATNSVTTATRTSTGSVPGGEVYASTAPADADKGVPLGGAAGGAGGTGLRDEDFARSGFSLTELIAELSVDDLRRLQPLIRLIDQCEAAHVMHMWDLSAQFYAIAIIKKTDVHNQLVKESFRWFLCALFRTWLDLHCFTHDEAVLVSLITRPIRHYWKAEFGDFLKPELAGPLIGYFSRQVRDASNSAVRGSETAACMLQSPEWLFGWDLYREQLNPAIFDRSTLCPTGRARRKSAPAIETYNPVTYRRGSVPNLTVQREVGITTFDRCLKLIPSSC